MNSTHANTYNHSTCATVANFFQGAANSLYQALAPVIQQTHGGNKPLIPGDYEHNMATFNAAWSGSSSRIGLATEVLGKKGPDVLVDALIGLATFLIAQHLLHESSEHPTEQEANMSKMLFSQQLLMTSSILASPIAEFFKSFFSPRQGAKSQVQALQRLMRLMSPKIRECFPRLSKSIQSNVYQNLEALQATVNALEQSNDPGDFRRVKDIFFRISYLLSYPSGRSDVYKLQHGECPASQETDAAQAALTKSFGDPDTEKALNEVIDTRATT
ncbi:MAG: hypothetical protein HC848_01795, partial [Limnobacter sp.]|nr:hypothetical protein [Limnobacter sp.]